MNSRKKPWWERNKYFINGLILILIGYYFYQSLNPKFPDLWETKAIGEFEFSPMPFDLEQPYLHHGIYTKDFFLFVKKGEIKNIRQAFINIGVKALPLDELARNGEGILHGSQHGQEVHAIAPKEIKADHKMWLTLENWRGQRFVVHWELPQTLLENI